MKTYCRTFPSKLDKREIRIAKENIFLDCDRGLGYAKIMDLEHIGWRLFFIRLVEIVFIVNIAILDLLVLQSFPQYKASLNTISTQQTIPTPTPTIVAVETSPIPLIQPTTIIQTSGAKEIYVPLGTGESIASSWTNVPGVIAYIDTSKYSSIKQVVFEANINVATANQTVWIQLYNMTGQHPVWNSQMSMTGATQYVVSPPITLDQGNNLYQVQMYTQLQYPAELTQARIHITLN